MGQDRIWSPFNAPLPPPDRDIRLLRQGYFETFEQADTRRQERINQLWRSWVPGAPQVAYRLANCETGNRCLSPACPVCTGRVRIWLCGGMLKLWPPTRPRTSILVSITLIDERWAASPNGLSNFSFKRAIDSVRQQFRRISEKPFIVIGAIDGEFDIDRNMWQPHFHLTAEGKSLRFCRLLRAYYPRTQTIKRPMVQKPVRDYPRQFSYILKPYWSYKKRIRSSRKRKPTYLREPHLAEYLIKLNAMDFSGLFLLIGVRRYGNELVPQLN